MGDLLHVASGKPKYVPAHLEGEAIRSKLYAPLPGSNVTVEQDGRVFQVTGDRLDQFTHADPISPDEYLAREQSARIAEDTAGAAQGVRTFIESGADTATGGAYGAAADYLGGEESARLRRERQIGRPGVALAGTLAGIGASVLVPGGATGTAAKIARNTPMALAERVGARIAGRGTAAAAERGLVGQVARSAAGYGVEGGLVGAGAALQAETIKEGPLDMERLTASLGPSIFQGAVAGGLIGAGGTAAAKGISHASKMVRKGRAARALAATDDISKMTDAQLDALQRTTAETLGGDVVEYARKLEPDSDLFHLTSGAEKRAVNAGRARIRHAIGDAKGMAKSPGKVMPEVLRREEQIARSVLSDPEKALARLKSVDTKALRTIDDALSTYGAGKIKIDGADAEAFAQLLGIKPKNSFKIGADRLAKFRAASKGDEALKRVTRLERKMEKSQRFKLVDDEATLYGDLMGAKVKGKGPKSGVRLNKTQLRQFKALLESEQPLIRRQAALSRLENSLGENVGMQAHLDDIANSTHPKLAQIGEAKRALVDAAKPGLVSQVGNSLLGMVGLGRVGNTIKGLVTKRVGKVAAVSAQRSADAITALMAAGNKVKPAVVPLASHTLSQLSYGREPVKPPRAVHENFSRLAKQIDGMSEVGPKGHRMTRAARQQVADGLEGLRAVSPIAADRVETVAARKVAFLAKKLPREGGPSHMRTGPRKWKPSNAAVRLFARYALAAEDPASVEERIANGTVTPAEAEALREIYPAYYEDIKRRVVLALPSLQQRLPYRQRLALSIFSGVPVDPALAPEMLSVLQGGYTSEPGSEGGTQAPRATAQFGSISKQPYTDSQKRSI